MSNEQIELPSTLFISHASKDEKYVRELVNVLTLLGIPNIVCSSLDRYQIPTGEDIYDYLKKQLSSSTRVLFLLSKNFYRSTVCLNEMGACWVLDKNYFTLLTPDFNFEEVAGVINASKLSFKINNNRRLYELVELLQEEFQVQRKIPSIDLLEVINQAIEKINVIYYDGETDENRVSAKIDSYKIDNENNKLGIAVRIINPTMEKILIDSVIFNLKDSQGKVLSEEVTEQEVIHTKENKFFYFNLDYEKSEFSIYDEPLEENVLLRTRFDRFPN